MQWLLVVLLMLLTPVATVSGTAAQSAEDEAVLRARDMGAVLQLFADDAVVATSSGRLLRGTSRSGVGCKTKWSGANERKRVPARDEALLARQGVSRRLADDRHLTVRGDARRDHPRGQDPLLQHQLYARVSRTVSGRTQEKLSPTCLTKNADDPTPLTLVGNSADSPEPLLRPSPATGHEAEILDV
jgi:hypothetical protein